MLYCAIYNEIYEGTALFKITNRPPVKESDFINIERLPEDRYLRLCGAGAIMLRGEIPYSEEISLKK